MYKILRTAINDNGIDPDKAIADASGKLALDVIAASADGWTPLGGVEVFSRQKPHGLMVWLMQTVIQTPRTASLGVSESAEAGDKTKDAPLKPKATNAK